MMVIGLTGPSGAGKGAVAQIMSEYGIKHIDADAVYHNILIPPSECLDELVEYFGYGILNAGGMLDRKVLAGMVFGDENREKLEALNKITHKYVCARIRQIVRHFENSGELACVIDAPLLFEAGVERDCNITVAVLADKGIRAERIAERDNITISAAEIRINSQKCDDFYREKADVCIYNNGDMDHLKKTVIELLDQYSLGGLV